MAKLRNNIWQISYKDPVSGKLRHRTTGIKNIEAWDEEEKRFLTKAEIKRKVLAMEAKKDVEIAEGKFLDIKREELVKFKDFASLYLTTYSRVSLKTAKSDENFLDPENPKGLIAHFGEMYLHEITALDIEKYKQFRLKEDKVLASTVNVGLKLLSAMFNKAIKWKKIFNNPCKDVDRLNNNNRRLRYFTIEELERIKKFSSEPMKSIILIAVSTGMRRAEVLNIQWPDVDMGRNQICLLDQKNNKISYVPIKHIRNIFLKIQVKDYTPYVFHNSRGNRLDANHVSNMMRHILNSLGIKGASFHTLRHTFASHLAMAGVGLYTISKRMRHSNTKMTEIYTHLSKENDENATDILAARFDVILEDDTKTTHSDSEADNREFNSIVSQIDTTTSN